MSALSSAGRRKKGFPCIAIPGGQRQGVFAYRQELDEWLIGLNHADVVEKFRGHRKRLEWHPGHSGKTRVSGIRSLPCPDSGNRTPYWRRAFYSAFGFLAALVP